LSLAQTRSMSAASIGLLGSRDARSRSRLHRRAY
jgi:hypothetical protein